jgi:hypothetical protein
MSDEAEDEHRAEQLSQVFALLTAKLEDAATLAADGQGRRPDGELLRFASQIAELTNEAATIAGAIAALLTKTRTGVAE